MNLKTVLAVLALLIFSGCAQIKTKSDSLKPNLTQVAILSKKTSICEGVSISECNDLGVKFELGDDLENAKIYYKYACDNSLGVACSNLGSLYQKINGQSNIDSLNLFLKACELKSSYGCYNAANAYRLGDATEHNFVRAIKLYEKACIELGHAMSCTNLGGMHQFSLGVAVADRDTAKKFYKMGCDLKDEIGCKNLSLIGE